MPVNRCQWHGVLGGWVERWRILNDAAATVLIGRQRCLLALGRFK